jgi:hypothetical protein
MRHSPAYEGSWSNGVKKVLPEKSIDGEEKGIEDQTL